MPYNFRTLSAIMAEALIYASNDPLLANEWSSRVVSPEASARGDTANVGLTASVRRFLAGDHWQDNDGWVGPRPVDPDTGALDFRFMQLVAERFVSRNMIEDVMTRHVDGLVGREPAWGFVPTRPLASDEKPNAEEQNAIDTIEAELTRWWDKRQCHRLMQHITAEPLLSGRGVLRVFVPAARRVDLTNDIVPDGTNETGTLPTRNATATDVATVDEASTAIVGNTDPNAPPAPLQGVIAATLADALDHIFVEVVPGDDGTVYADTDSMEQIGVVRYHMQGTYPGDVGPRVVELCYLDGLPTDPKEERDTIIRIATSNELPVTLPLGGRLTHYAVVRPPLISAQVVQMQKALNFALSMLPRNVETSGFRERIISNGQLPGTWDVDEDGNKTGGFTPAPYGLGAGTTTWITGTEITQEDTTKSLADPKVTIADAMPVQPTTDAIDKLEHEILFEAKQAHILGTDQIQSGVSRQQARADFEKSLGRSAAVLEPAGRWLLETVLWMACVFAADTQGIDPSLYRAQFSALIETGPPDPRDASNVLIAADKGIVSQEFAMSQLGIEDTDAELARMNEEAGRRAAIRLSLLQNLKAGVDAGLSLETSAQLAGFDEDDVKLIAKDELQNPVPAPAPMFDAQGKLIAGQPPQGAQPPAPAPPTGTPTNPALANPAPAPPQPRQAAGAA
jgi:hypothetical protein